MSKKVFNATFAPRLSEAAVDILISPTSFVPKSTTPVESLVRLSAAFKSPTLLIKKVNFGLVKFLSNIFYKF